MAFKYITWINKFKSPNFICLVYYLWYLWVTNIDMKRIVRVHYVGSIYIIYNA